MSDIIDALHEVLDLIAPQWADAFNEITPGIDDDSRERFELIDDAQRHVYAALATLDPTTPNDSIGGAK